MRAFLPAVVALAARAVLVFVRARLRAATRVRGSVGIASKPGAGSVFWFELPKATPATVNDSPEIVPSLVLS